MEIERHSRKANVANDSQLKDSTRTEAVKEQTKYAEESMLEKQAEQPCEDSESFCNEIGYDGTKRFVGRRARG